MFYLSPHYLFRSHHLVFHPPRPSFHFFQWFYQSSFKWYIYLFWLLSFLTRFLIPITFLYDQDCYGNLCICKVRYKGTPEHNIHNTFWDTLILDMYKLEYFLVVLDEVMYVLLSQLFISHAQLSFCLCHDVFLVSFSYWYQMRKAFLYHQILIWIIVVNSLNFDLTLILILFIFFWRHYQNQFWIKILEFLVSKHRILVLLTVWCVHGVFLSIVVMCFSTFRSIFLYFVTTWSTTKTILLYDYLETLVNYQCYLKRPILNPYYQSVFGQKSCSQSHPTLQVWKMEAAWMWSVRYLVRSKLFDYWYLDKLSLHGLYDYSN